MYVVGLAIPCLPAMHHHDTAADYTVKGSRVQDLEAPAKNLFLLSRMKHWAWLIKHSVQVQYGDDKNARVKDYFIFDMIYTTF